MTKADVPTYDELMNPVIEALKELGGSGTVEEINNKAIELAGLSDEQTEVLHKPEKGGGRTEVEYRLAWTRRALGATNSWRRSWRWIHPLSSAWYSVYCGSRDSSRSK
jgi:restriction system protein